MNTISPGQYDYNLAGALDPSSSTAFHRTATLIAGQTAGSQGNVRVWEPSSGTLRRRAIVGWALLSFVLVSLGLQVTVQFWFWIVGLGITHYLNHFRIALDTLTFLAAGLSFRYLPSVPSLRKPCLVSADDNGIGISTRKRSLALPWTEITHIERRDLLNCFLLQTRSGDHVGINPDGLSSLARGELWNTITRKSGRRQIPMHSNQALDGPASHDSAAG